MRIAKERQIECFILCDTSHVFEKDGAQTLIFSKGRTVLTLSWSIEWLRAILHHTGLWTCSHVPVKRSPRNQSGRNEYTADNIDALLLARHTAKKIRHQGEAERTEKRSAVQDEKFNTALTFLLDQR